MPGEHLVVPMDIKALQFVQLYWPRMAAPNKVTSNRSCVCFLQQAGSVVKGAVGQPAFCV